MKLIQKVKRGNKYRIYFLGIRIYKRIDPFPAPIIPTHYGDKFIYSDEAGNNLILKELQKNKPCLISRFGRTELKVLEYFYAHLNDPKIEFPAHLKETIGSCSGFFPLTDEMLTRFCCELLGILPNLNIIGVWNYDIPTEKETLLKYDFSHSLKLTELGPIGDLVVTSANPWTQYLKGKKVLVIHPFEKTIRQQYAKRTLLFKDERHLPEFELKTIKAVQGLGDNLKNYTFKNWFEALESMCRQIDETDFDIALVGAGAYGIFLADYCKKLGKQAVHVGGATQLLFGIKGERWEKAYGAEFGRNLFNEHWINPLPEELPQNMEKFTKLEGAKAYW